MGTKRKIYSSGWWAAVGTSLQYGAQWPTDTLAGGDYTLTTATPPWCPVWLTIVGGSGYTVLCSSEPYSQATAAFVPLGKRECLFKPNTHTHTCTLSTVCLENVSPRVCVYRCVCHFCGLLFFLPLSSLIDSRLTFANRFIYPFVIDLSSPCWVTDWDITFEWNKKQKEVEQYWLDDGTVCYTTRDDAPPPFHSLLMKSIPSNTLNSD